MTARRRPRALARVIAAAAPVVAAAGCLDSLDPDVGPPLRAVCEDVDSDPLTSISYRRDVVDGILGREDLDCVRCHTAGGDSPIGLLVGGLDLGGYAGLRQGGAQAGADIIIPGRPCDSALYRKVVPGPPFGARMPLDGPPYLTAADVQVIVDWIAEGARED